MLLLKRLAILFWWNFLLKKDEFSHKLNLYFSVEDAIRKTVVRREVAHYLDEGKSVFDLPDELIKHFSFTIHDVLSKEKSLKYEAKIINKNINEKLKSDSK